MTRRALIWLAGFAVASAPMAIAIGHKLASDASTMPAASAPALSPDDAATWQLQMETRDDVAIIDHGLTLQDCADMAAPAQRQNPQAEFICSNAAVKGSDAQ